MARYKGFEGTIRVTWSECPNKTCKSRDWDHWDVVYEGDQFECGSCQKKLMRPMFYCPLKHGGAECPFQEKKAQNG